MLSVNISIFVLLLKKLPNKFIKTLIADFTKINICAKVVFKEYLKNQFPIYLKRIIVWQRRDVACYVSTVHQKIK